ncbi:MAG TPA: carboxylating nicotinate-nucleotide diphosphorylase [bacterium]|nr:carboxylating nicotinate-nucleotide diphosphorylase [bacterium]
MTSKPDFMAVLHLLRKALEEDGAWKDRTTFAVVPPGLKSRGEIVGKSDGILAGLPVVEQVFKILDKRSRVKALVLEGQKVHRGMVVARLEGFARPLLSGERVALNLLGRLSGVATLTRKFTSLVKGPSVYDTRKTTPLWRILERYAVRVGGGRNHRFNLAGHVLIKDNHLRLGGGVFACVTAARRKYGRTEPIEVEVETFQQASEALRAGADILLVDNNSPKDLKKIIRLVHGKVEIEVSGGLTLETVRGYSRLPIQRLSSGALTHSAPSVDFSIELYPR